VTKTLKSRRIVMATLGSLGDLHPMLALALELKRRGHSVTIASSRYYRDKVEGLGIGFAPLSPDWNPTDREIIAQCEDLKSGPEVLFRKLLLPHLREIYGDLLRAATGADLMIAGELVFAAPLVAEKLGLRWVSEILSPTSFFSAHDPSLLVNAPVVYRLRKAGWVVNRAVLEFGKLMSRHWWEPVRQLRREIGLRVQCDPVFKDKFSPDLVLALFSSTLAQPQPDWPKQTLQPGFVFFDREKAGVDDFPELAAFLAAGDAPIVFTLGSTAVHNPGNFYEASAAAARKLGKRAVLLGTAAPADADPAYLLALQYAPYSQIFPHGAAIVHQGGSGTTGQVMRAGRPQLIVPYGWDQPDNGARVARLGLGLCLARSEYLAQTAANTLETLLGTPQIAARASEVGEQIRSEDALTVACDAIEAVLTAQNPHRFQPDHL
jgi:UDP:flavonoid glycosyltransferase YjiC (YdhE family)